VFKFEGGSHRVQRVPDTESQGRIHTSTATVAVLPEAEDVEVAIDPNDRKAQEALKKKYLALGRWDDLEPFVEAVYDRFGKVDVLFNNAGMSPVYDKLTDVSEKLFDSVINLNFKGPFRLAALIGERMHAAGGGSIINVSSSGSIRPTGRIIPYAGAKAALNAMSEGLAEGLGPQVRVNTLMPGTFQTDVSKAWDLDAVTEDRRQHTALQRVGQPPEIIGAALFLASDASSYTSGTIIRVDGGMF